MTKHNLTPMPSLDSKSDCITINIDNKADTVSGKLELGKNSFAQTANELQEQGGTGG